MMPGAMAHLLTDGIDRVVPQGFLVRDLGAALKSVDDRQLVKPPRCAG